MTVRPTPGTVRPRAFPCSPSAPGTAATIRHRSSGWGESFKPLLAEGQSSISTDPEVDSHTFGWCVLSMLADIVRISVFA